MPEQRKHHRVEVKLKARFMLQDGSEHQAETKDVSLTGVRFASLAVPFRGQKVVAYISDLGRIEGTATRIMKGGFAMSIATSGRRRDKMAGALTWARLESGDGRQSERIVPDERSARLTLLGGPAYSVQILNFSKGGAAVVSEAFLPLGTQVTLGSHSAIILRVEDGAYAIAFERELPAELVTRETRFI